MLTNENQKTGAGGWRSTVVDLVHKFLDVSIRTKILGLVLVCILFSAVALVWYTDRDSKMFLRMNLEETGSTVARILAERGVTSLAGDDFKTLDTDIDLIIDINKDISYIFLQDSDGVVRAGATDGTVFTDLSHISTSGSGTYPLITRIEIQGRRILNVTMPVGETGGMLHVGLQDEQIQHTVATHISHIMVWFVLVLILGLLLAYVLSRAMTQPIYLLAAEARDLGRGLYREKNRRWGPNEIGALGSAFDEMSREIRSKEEMRGQLVAKILSAQEEERKRIARELHDDTSQNLTSLLVELKAAEKITDGAEIKEKLTALRELAHKTLEDVHGIAVELRPNVLDDLGLNAALEKYVADYQAKTGIKVDLHITLAARRRWSPEIETAAYRIAQEALANVTRHSRANNVSIVVGYQGGRLNLIVEDDGVGFDLSKALRQSPEHRLGLFGMDERAALIGGKLVIESNPGQGTSVFLEVPIKEEKNDKKDQNTAG